MDFKPNTHFLKFQKTFLLVLTISFGIINFCQSQEFKEQNHQLEKQYMFIPWGYEKGRLPSSSGNGPGFFRVDKDGSVYVYCYDNKQHTLLKFDKQANEIGRISLEGVPFKFEVGDDEIFTVCGLNNNAAYISKDLKKEEKIKIPDSFPAWMANYENGVVYTNRSDKTKTPKSYVYDQEKWEKSGRPQKQINLLSTIKFEKEQEGNELDVYISYPSGIKTKIWGTMDQTIRNIKLLGQDQHSNIFVQISSSADMSSIMDSIVLKISVAGNVLGTLYVKSSDSVTGYCGSRVIPIAIDQDGNVYSARTSGAGFYIDEEAF